MMTDTLIIKFDSSDNPSIDYKSVEINLSTEPLWSDGRMDGTFIPKMIGVVPNPPDGKITLQDGSIIRFTNYTVYDDGVMVILSPYSHDDIVMV